MTALETMAYDAASRMGTYTDGGVAANSRTYGYDGDGRRVLATRTSTGDRTVYVYDAFGRLAAEYSETASSGGGGLQYRTTDSLGSTRLTTDAAGAATAYYDFKPFGERIGSGVGGRSSLWGDDGGFQQQFTGQYRDKESGLDYFGARYFSAGVGRFTSPDLPLIDQSPNNPQSWNLYAYVRNNPLRFVDPTGFVCITFDDGSVGDTGTGSVCDDPAAQLGTAHGTKVEADNGNLASAIALNSLFYVNNLANDFFAFLFTSRPVSLQNTPLSSEFQAAADSAYYA